jgi:hypothetical protein
MKKMFAVLAIVLLIAAAAMATITLNNTVVQTHTQGGTTVETDDTANVTGALNNFQAQTLQIRVDFGSMNGQPSSRARRCRSCSSSSTTTSANTKAPMGRSPATSRRRRAPR